MRVEGTRGYRATGCDHTDHDPHLDTVDEGPRNSAELPTRVLRPRLGDPQRGGR
jgi:hypothetical protein